MPKARFENGVDVIDDLMLIKDAAEIERLRHAAEVSDYGFEQGMNAVRAGATENEIAGEIERAIRRRGSTWSWAVTGGTEVGAGERTGFLRGVTQQATDRPIGRDEFVILDLHPLLDLYMADTALPIFLGRPTGAQAALIDCWEETVQTMLTALTPGRAIADCARRGIAVFEKHGLAEFGLPCSATAWAPAPVPVPSSTCAATTRSRRAWWWHWARTCTGPAWAACGSNTQS